MSSKKRKRFSFLNRKEIHVRKRLEEESSGQEKDYYVAEDEDLRRVTCQCKYDRSKSKWKKNRKKKTGNKIARSQKN